MTAASRGAAKTDALVALIFVFLFGASIFASLRAAADAVQRYGRNVDSGAVEAIVGVTYFAPVAALFAVAAVAQWRGWRVGRPAHYVAFVYLVAPLALLIVSGLRSAL